MSFCTRILYMECHSFSTIVLDGRSQTTCPQEWHILSLHRLLLWKPHTTNKKSTRKILFGCFMTNLNDTFEVEFTQEDEGYESGMKTSAPQLHSTETQKSTMSPQWMLSPLTMQILVDHLHLWIIMQSHYLTDTDATTSHTTTCCSPALMMKVQRGPVNDVTQLPVPMLGVQPPGKQMFHPQYITSCPPWTLS